VTLAPAAVTLIAAPPEVRDNRSVLVAALTT
jgi:hypothetical protein